MTFDHLKAKAGLGGAKLEIHIQRGEPRRGEPLRGKVHLLGGKAKRKIRCLHLRLLRDWSAERYEMNMVITAGVLDRLRPLPGAEGFQAQYELEGEKGTDELLNIELGRDIQIHAGERRIFPFEIELPKKRMEKGVREVWKLQAQADIPLARDAFAERKIKLK